MHSGGIADKIGNRFEATWIMRHLLQLIDGRALSVTIEKLGGEGAGFEFSLSRGSTIEWHQSKRQSSSNWTVNRLIAEGVLGHFKAKIESDSAATCLFVSTDPVRPLKSLKEKLPAAQDVRQFEQSLSDIQQTEWQLLKEALELGSEATFDWLARCEFVTFPERELVSTLEAELSRWFGDEPLKVMGLLRRWIEDDVNFNRPLGRADLLDHLETLSVTLKQYEFDRTIPGKLVAANRGYGDSYRPIGAGLFEIEREETGRLLDAIEDDDGPPRIALAGGAGSGKSAIIRKVLARLAESPRRVLAMRLDQVGQIATLADLGNVALDVADSPAVVLEQVAQGRPAVLIIDQADAVSEMSGRATEVRAVMLRLLRQAAYYPHVKIIFSCRTFDLDNDHEFRAIADPETCTRIDVGPLRWNEDVGPVLSRLGIGVGKAGTKIQALLCQPIGLTIAAELARDGPLDLGHVEHISQLYEELLKQRERELLGRNPPPWALFDVLTAIARTMSEREELAVPVMVLDRYSGAVDRLQQAGLIMAHGRKIALMHETLFDYLHARAFVGDGKKLPEFLLSAEQTLFRRTQVRQILAMERDLDRPAYLAHLQFILTDERVRPHVRDLVLRWIATIPDPTIEEWSILLASEASEHSLPRHCGRVIYGSPGWIALLEREAILSSWFDEAENDDLAWALRSIEMIAKDAESLAVRILRSFADRRPDRLAYILRAFVWFQPDRPMPKLAELLLEALAQCDQESFETLGESPFHLADGWIKHSPEEAGRLYAAVLDSWYRLHDEGTPFGDDHHRLHGDFYHFGDLAEADAVIALRSIFPAMRIAMERTSIGDAAPFEDRNWHDRSRDLGDGPHAIDFLDIVRGSLQKIASETPGKVPELLAALDPGQHMTALHLLLEAVGANGDLAPLLAEQIDNPGLFDAGWYMARAYSAGKAIAASWPFLDSVDRDRLAARLLRHFPEQRSALQYFKESNAEPVEGNFPPETYKSWARYSLEASGYDQWSTLHQMQEVELSPALSRRFTELTRKFKDREPRTPSGTISGSVRSPIAPERAAKMNDRAWMSAMATDWSKGRTFAHGYFRGDAGDLARVLDEEVKKDPERFLALYWHLPPKTPEVFLRAILNGVVDANRGIDDVDALITRLERDGPGRPDEAIFLRLIERKSGAEPGPVALAKLHAIAASGDGRKSGGRVRGGQKRQPDPLYKIAMDEGSLLEWSGRHSNRGKALTILRERAWTGQAEFDDASYLVDKLIEEQAPAHLLALIGAFAQAAIKHGEKARAADWLAAVAARAPLALANDLARRALLWLDRTDHTAAAPIFRTLLRGKHRGMSALAAALIMLRSIDEPRWDLERLDILDGNVQWRCAAAHVISGEVSKDHRDESLNALLASFFSDRSVIVRRVAADVFRRLDTRAMAIHSDLYRSYLSTRYFSGERTYFLYRLEDAPAELDALVLELIELVAAKSQTQKGSDAGYRLWEPLLRIYTSNSFDFAIRERCLDVIDLLVTRGVYGADKLQDALR